MIISAFYKVFEECLNHEAKQFVLENHFVLENILRQHGEEFLLI